MSPYFIVRVETQDFASLQINKKSPVFERCRGGGRKNGRERRASAGGGALQRELVSPG